MTRIATTAFVFGCLLAAPALAALKPGDAAPEFTAKAAVGGKEFSFSLADALRKGPVVLYFFPKAFTKGCTQEAHDFAQAAAKYSEAGATLIGMSADNIATLHKFSTQECSARFPVAADPDLKVIKAYDNTWKLQSGATIADRTSYVISPEGKIVYAYTDRNPDKHVENTLAVVKMLETGAKK